MSYTSINKNKENKMDIVEKLQMLNENLNAEIKDLANEVENLTIQTSALEGHIEALEERCAEFLDDKMAAEEELSEVKEELQLWEDWLG